jgi:hypothetical protein
VFVANAFHSLRFDCTPGARRIALFFLGRTLKGTLKKKSEYFDQHISPTKGKTSTSVLQAHSDFSTRE